MVASTGMTDTDIAKAVTIIRSLPEAGDLLLYQELCQHRFAPRETPPVWWSSCLALTAALYSNTRV